MMKEHRGRREFTETTENRQEKRVCVPESLQKSNVVKCQAPNLK